MFWKRLFSTIVLLSVFSCSIFLPSPWCGICFAVIALPIAFFAPWEMTGMMKNIGRHSYRTLVSLAVTLSAVVSFMIMDYRAVVGSQVDIFLFSFLFLLLMGFGAWVILLFIKNTPEKLDCLINTIGVIFLFGIPIFIIPMIYSMDVGIFLFFIIMTKIGDIGAYVVGTLSNKITKGGNHKIVPSISPGKSWEGTIGGLVIANVCCYFMLNWMPPKMFFIPEESVPLWLVFVIGTVMFFGGAIGDLTESAIKRTCNVKDSGHTIPGIGGVFDLVDSLMLNSIVFMLMIWILETYC